MTIRKSLTEIVVALAISGAGCNVEEKEYFNGRIDDEQVRLYQAGSDSPVGNPYNMVLEVTKVNGEKVFYGDQTNDNKVDYVVGTSFENDPLCPCRSKTQAKYDYYLTKIDVVVKENKIRKY